MQPEHTSEFTHVLEISSWILSTSDSICAANLLGATLHGRLETRFLLIVFEDVDVTSEDFLNRDQIAGSSAALHHIFGLDILESSAFSVLSKQGSSDDTDSLWGNGVLSSY